MKRLLIVLALLAVIVWPVPAAAGPTAQCWFTPSHEIPLGAPFGVGAGSLEPGKSYDVQIYQRQGAELTGQFTASSTGTGELAVTVNPFVVGTVLLHIKPSRAGGGGYKNGEHGSESCKTEGMIIPS